MKSSGMVGRVVGGFGGRVAFFAALAVVLVAPSARAQSTIFNIPSTDVVSAKKSYVEFDVLPQAPQPSSGAIMFINPRYVMGLPMNVEVGVNLPIYHYADTPSGSTSTYSYFQADLKWKFYAPDKSPVAASAGTIINTPMNQRDGQKTWAAFYGNVSYKAAGMYGPRITAGPYGIAQSDDATKSGFVGTKGGVLLGYEQPIMGPLSFVADWFSGENSLGYFTPGVSIALPHSGLVNVGYSFGNDSWSKTDKLYNKYDRFFFAYYGITFP